MTTTHILGAPGSGKTAVTELLRPALPGHVVVDWDAFMPAAGALAGRDIRQSPSKWPAYRDLMRAVVEALFGTPLVLLGVCTPDELEGWPIDSWLLLDCSDAARRGRLLSRADHPHIEAALADAARYRSLGLRAVDTTDRTVADVTAELATLLDSES